MPNLTSNHLYRATAPLLTEDPEMQASLKPQPPHKFWRAKWEIRPPASSIWFNPSVPYNRLPPFYLAYNLAVAGPVCTTSEMAEQLAVQALHKCVNCSTVNLTAIKTDEHGAPL